LSPDSQHTAQLGGVVGALLTPFDDDAKVDEVALGRLIDFLLPHVDAISVLGAEVSEYRCLTPDRRRSLLGEVTAQLSGRTTVMAGASAQTPGEVVELTHLAAEAGADLVQVLMPNRPWGGAPSPAELITFFTEVASQSPLPVALYHHPGQGADPAWGTIIELCQIDNVVAMKDSSRNIARCLRGVEEIERPGYARYLGTIQPMLAILLSGGSGAMMPPPLTVIGAAIRDAVLAGDLAAAGAAQRRIALLPDKWSQYGLTPITKRAMELVGIPLGDPAGPFAALPRDADDELRTILADWPLNEKATVK
jgi:4-hydroxy-tetrahydrodipicolinate synthase